LRFFRQNNLSAEKSQGFELVCKVFSEREWGLLVATFYLFAGARLGKQYGAELAYQRYDEPYHEADGDEKTYENEQAIDRFSVDLADNVRVVIDKTVD